MHNAKKVRITVSERKAKELRIQANYEFIIAFLKKERAKLDKRIKRVGAKRMPPLPQGAGK